MEAIGKEFIDRIVEQLKDEDVHKLIFDKFTSVSKKIVHPEGYEIDGDRVEQECQLKEKICNELCSPANRDKLYHFIIHTWGGIGGFKSFDKCYGDDLENALKKLESISSLSKIKSFSDPQKYFIYDSQAVFSLNWLLLNAGYQGPFFPIPEGQGNNTKEYNLETIIRLMGYKIAAHKGKDRDETIYDTYNQTILKIHESAKYDIDKYASRPFLIEMLLYSYTNTAYNKLKSICTNNDGLNYLMKIKGQNK